MAQVSPILRKSREGYSHWCEACRSAHYFPIEPGPGPRWTFNGDVNNPSFEPSMRIFTPAFVDGRGVQRAEHTICHYFIRGGEIQYCGDSAHELKGTNRPLAVMPSEQEYGYHD